MNLYMVLTSQYDWCCFAFDVSRNKAKIAVAQEFDCEYTEMRCKTLKKGVNILSPMLVTDDESEGYEIVKSLGYEYGEDADFI